MSFESSDLDQLAEACGIEAEYYDYRSRLTRISPATRRRVLEALGYDVDTEADVQASLLSVREAGWREILAPVTVIREDRAPMLRLNVAESLTRQPMLWELALENGELMEGRVLLGDRQPKAYRLIDEEEYRRYLLQLPSALPPGYHDFELKLASGERLAAASVIIAPQRCYEPSGLTEGHRCWGFATQLYTVRSRHDWGIGDLRDLRAMLQHAAAQGADFIGLNPLHALYPATPEHNSPYSPSTRAQLNLLYIAVPEVAEYDDCPGARALVGSVGFQQRLAAARADDYVDYEAVAGLKLPVLRKLHRHFREHHLARNSGRAQAFERYVAQMGEALFRHALYDALQAFFCARDPGTKGWSDWPEEFASPDSDAVRDFGIRERQTVEFYQYLQWLTDEQLASAQRVAEQAGMSIGVYRDLAVSADANGAEAWMNQALYCNEMRIGAPPDPLALQGQEWGLPPMNPFAFKARGYRDFIAMLRANMRHCGALRIDHVVGLLRQWWVPAGGTPVDGAYVRFPLDDLLGILALESQRNRCMVIGEDLGIVPEEIREPLRESGVYSYRVLYFEQDAQGEFLSPREYPAQALCTVTTHDLATFCAWWEQLDLKLREQLALFPDEETRLTSAERRGLDRGALLAALRREGLLPPSLAGDSSAMNAEGTTPWPLSVAVHAFLARSASALMCVQPEDLLQMRVPVNVPGTSREHRNWSRKLSMTLEQMFGVRAIVDACRLIDEERRRASAGTDSGGED